MEESPTRGGARPDETQPLKRKSVHEPERQSESPKRARTGREDVSTGDASPDAPIPSPYRTEAPQRSLEDTKRRVSQEEKRRGMRLFGGLLGTLSQRPTNPHQQKRQEIEKRQQERLKQQRAEEQKAAREKKAKLEETRTRESINWEERVLHVRHSTLRSKAKFLRTNARPHIFYKPWIVTAEQKSKIQQQRHDVEDTIEKELEEFQIRRETHARKYAPQTEPAERGASPAREEAEENTEPAERGASPEREEAEENTEPTKDSGRKGSSTEGRAEPQSAPDQDHHDESNDVVVESGEDVVIY